MASPGAHDKATEICQRILGAPARALARTCTGEEKSGRAYQYLSTQWLTHEARCTAILERAIDAGRFQADPTKVEGCAAALERSWKRSLEHPFLEQAPECQGIFAGTQAAGAPCESSVECAVGLSCGTSSNGQEKRCASPVDVAGAVCANTEQPFGGDHPDCRAGLTCDPPYRVNRAVEGHLFGDLQPDVEAGSSPDSWGATPAQVGITGVERGIHMGSLWTSIASGAATGQGFIPDAAGTLRKRAVVRLGEVVVDGKMAKSAVKRVLRERLRQWGLCYENWLSRSGPNKATAQLTFTIDPDGAVSTAKTTGLGADEAHCFVAKIVGATLPKVQAATNVTASLSLEQVEVSADVDLDPPTCHEPDSASLRLPDLQANPRPDKPHKAGEACDGMDCAEGLYCSYSSKSEPRCSPLKQAGAACTSSLQCEGLCVDFKCAAFCGSH